MRSTRPYVLTAFSKGLTARRVLWGTRFAKRTAALCGGRGPGHRLCHGRRPPGGGGIRLAGNGNPHLPGGALTRDYPMLAGSLTALAGSMLAANMAADCLLRGSGPAHPGKEAPLARDKPGPGFFRRRGFCAGGSCRSFCLLAGPGWTGVAAGPASRLAASPGDGTTSAGTCFPSCTVLPPCPWRPALGPRPAPPWRGPPSAAWQVFFAAGRMIF